MDAANYEVIQACSKDEIEACLQLKVEVGVVEDGLAPSEVEPSLNESKVYLLLNLLDPSTTAPMRRVPVGCVGIDPTTREAGQYAMLKTARDAGMLEVLQRAALDWQPPVSGGVHPASFNRKAHVRYFLRHLRHLPSAAEDHDTNRITIAYFCLSALDVLGVLYTETNVEQRKGWADWIWSLQTPSGGFRGSTAAMTGSSENQYDLAHLPSTYTSLLTLALLRDPFTRLNRTGLLAFVRRCQTEEGSFSPVPLREPSRKAHFQCDARMSYVAIAVSDMLSDFSQVDKPSAKRFIQSCQTWDGAYGARPGLEAQGGTTYCCLAALSMMCSSGWNNSAYSSRADVNSDSRWLLQRQIGGFQGRPGKLEDVCYSFWCGAALKLKGQAELINDQANVSFLLDSQFSVGGFAKEPDAFPDPFHSYLALAALSFSAAGRALRLQPLNVTWNITNSSGRWLTDALRQTSV